MKLASFPGKVGARRHVAQVKLEVLIALASKSSAGFGQHDDYERN